MDGPRTHEDDQVEARATAVPDESSRFGLRGGASWARAMFLILVVSGLVLVGYVAWGARLLRPIADDYCSAEAATRGFLGAQHYWYMTWSGDLTARAADFVTVGAPLLHLPWSWASAVAFVVTAVAVSVSAALLLYVSSSATPRGLLLTALIPAVAVAWWTYWWLPVRFPAVTPSSSVNVNNANLAHSVTLWQSVNSSYALLPALAVVGSIILVRVSRRRRRWALPFGAVFGFAVGMAGLVLAATFVGLATLWLAATFVRRDAMQGMRSTALIAIVGASIGALAAFTAPGNQDRSEILAQSQSLVNPSPATLLPWVFPRNLLEWGVGVVNPGSALVVVIMALLALAATKSGLGLIPARASNAAVGLLVASLVLSTVNRASEAFAYPAFWHQISTRTLVFLGLCMLGSAIGARAATLDGLRLTGVVLLLLVPSAIATIVSTQLMMETIEVRHTQWEHGPAPMPAISDTEDPAGWQADCWSTVGKYRDVPARASR